VVTAGVAAKPSQAGAHGSVSVLKLRFTHLRGGLFISGGGYVFVSGGSYPAGTGVLINGSTGRRTTVSMPGCSADVLGGGNVLFGCPGRSDALCDRGRNPVLSILLAGVWLAPSRTPPRLRRSAEYGRRSAESGRHRARHHLAIGRRIGRCDASRPTAVSDSRPGQGKSRFRQHQRLHQPSAHDTGAVPGWHWPLDRTGAGIREVILGARAARRNSRDWPSRPPRRPRVSRVVTICAPRSRNDDEEE
jgi:hypothetical protein